MKVPKLILAIALLFTIGLSTSCTKQDLSDEEIEIKAIDGNEIMPQDM